MFDADFLEQFDRAAEGVNTGQIVAAAIATGSIVSAAAYGINKPNCDFVVVNDDKEICISAEVKEAIESGLKENAGFGGVGFGGKK